MSLFILLEEEEMKTKERENMFLSHKGKTEENQTSFCCTAEFPPTVQSREVQMLKM